MTHQDHTKEDNHDTRETPLHRRRDHLGGHRRDRDRARRPGRRLTIGSERGSATLEAVIVVPALLLLIGLLVAGIRVSWAHNAVQSAAAAAARDGSLARSSSLAQSAAYQSASVSMNQSGAICNGQDVSLDTSQFLAPLGQTGIVTANVSCSVPLGNLVPGLPGSLTVTKDASSPVDPYRQR